MTRRTLAPVLLVAAALPAGTAVAGGPVASATASKIVVKAKQESKNADKLSVTYTSSKGTYTARWIAVRRYRLTGKINGRKLTGTIRTKQVKGDRYTASGSGKLGSRSVKISGGGPNSLKRATLILR